MMKQNPLQEYERAAHVRVGGNFIYGPVVGRTTPVKGDTKSTREPRDPHLQGAYRA